MSKAFTFDDLNKELSKISTYGDTLDKSEVSTVDHYISTGNYALNAALTGSVWGGFPNNRSIAIAGPSGTGKTYLILNAVREAQKLGYSIIYYDSENAVDKSLVEKFGIDPAKLRYEPCNTVQEFRSSVTNLTKMMLDAKKKGAELPRVMVILDSAGNLATQKGRTPKGPRTDCRDPRPKKRRTNPVGRGKHDFRPCDADLARPRVPKRPGPCSGRNLAR